MKVCLYLSVLCNKLVLSASISLLDKSMDAAKKRAELEKRLQVGWVATPTNN